LEKHVGVLGYEEATQLDREIKDGSLDDPVRESIMAGSKFLYDFDVKQARDDKDVSARDTATQIAEAGVERANTEKTLLEQDRRLKAEGKSPQERIAAADAVWQGPKEKAAKGLWQRFWDVDPWTVAFGPGGIGIQAMLGGRKRGKDESPEGLEGIWAQVTDQEKQTIHKALAQGRTVDEILAAFEESGD
jgi:hypothetical protein